MTRKQQRFCDEYLIDCNATQAAIRAGFKGTTQTNASRWLDPKDTKNYKPELKTYIDEKLQQMSNEKIASAEEVIRYLTSVLRGESKSEIVVVEAVGDGSTEARRIDKAPDEKERLKAAELLGKRYSIFTEKVNMDGDIDTVKQFLSELKK